MIGERIRQRRIMNGWSLQQLAERLAEKGHPVTRAVLSKYELEKSSPNAMLLKALASVFEIKTDYFFTDKAPSVAWQSFRKKASISQMKLNALMALADHEVESVLKVEHACGIAPSASRLPAPLKNANPDEAEACAKSLREEWSLGSNPISSVTELLESKGILVLPLGAEGDGIDGFVGSLSDGRYVIAYLRESSVDRTRFTIAHELGHLLLESDDPRMRESLAHRFAGAFLAPADMLFQRLGNHRLSLSIPELCLIKERYGISIQALTYRAKDLGILSPSVYQAMFIQFRAQGITAQEPGSWPYTEKSGLMLHYLFRAVEEGRLSEARARELLPEYHEEKDVLEGRSRSAVQRYLSLPESERQAYLALAAERGADLYSAGGGLLVEDIMDTIDDEE